MAAAMQLMNGVYAQPTPAGVFYAVGSAEPDPGRALLLNMLCDPDSTPLDRHRLLRWCETEDMDHALQILYRLQRMDFVRGGDEPGGAQIKGRLEDLLPPLLSQFSLNGRAVLADDKGFYLAAAGYPHEAAEELAALAVDLNLVYRRYSKLLKGNLKASSEALALVTPDGRSDLGFWPLHIGQQQFFLMVDGTPQLDQPALVSLVQVLAQRYR